MIKVDCFYTFISSIAILGLINKISTHPSNRLLQGRIKTKESRFNANILFDQVKMNSFSRGSVPKRDYQYAISVCFFFKFFRLKRRKIM